MSIRSPRAQPHSLSGSGQLFVLATRVLFPHPQTSFSLLAPRWASFPSHARREPQRHGLSPVGLTYGAYTSSNFHYVNRLPNAGLGPLSNLPLFFGRSEPLFLGLALPALVLHSAYFLLTPSHNHPDFHAHIDIHVYTYSIPLVLRPAALVGCIGGDPRGSLVWPLFWKSCICLHLRPVPRCWAESYRSLQPPCATATARPGPWIHTMTTSGGSNIIPRTRSPMLLIQTTRHSGSSSSSSRRPTALEALARALRIPRME